MFSAAHSIRSLHYRLIAGEVALEPLHILKTQDVIWHDWHVRFFVLGASHAVQLTRGTTQLTELLTCLPPAGDSKPLYETSVTQCRQKSLNANELRWDIRLWECETGNNEEQLPVGMGSSMQVEFPAIHSAEKPFTRINWLLHRNTLLVETLHTYPNEGRSVRSRTKLAPKQTVSRKELPE